MLPMTNCGTRQRIGDRLSSRYADDLEAFRVMGPFIPENARLGGWGCSAISIAQWGEWVDELQGIEFFASQPRRPSQNSPILGAAL